jgi:hypothetical protein
MGSSDFRWEGQSKVEVAIREKALILFGLVKRDQEEEHTWELADWEPEAATLEEMRPGEWTSLTVSGIPEDPLYKTLIGYVIDSTMYWMTSVPKFVEIVYTNAWGWLHNSRSLIFFEVVSAQ